MLCPHESLDPKGCLMTLCLALATTDISLVVADTRVNLAINSGSNTNQDGPTDLTISVMKPRYDLTVPFRFRKIRQTANGWVTSAGDYLLGRKLLDLISEHNTDSFAAIDQLLQIEYPRQKNEIQRQTGFSDEQLAGTVVMGAPFGQSTAWIISFDQSRAKTDPAVGNFVTNWPIEVSVEVKAQAQSLFTQELQLAISKRSIPGTARAAVRLVATAAKYSAQVGTYSQVGITIASPTSTKESLYLQGSSLELLSMSDPQIATSFEKIA